MYALKSQRSECELSGDILAGLGQRSDQAHTQTKQQCLQLSVNVLFLRDLRQLAVAFCHLYRPYILRTRLLGTVGAAIVSIGVSLEHSFSKV